MKTLLVFGDKTFRITIPDEARVTFGPWSPPPKDPGTRGWGEEGKRGTLRVYGRTKEDVLAVFAGVTGFRDMSIGYAEQVAKEEGATIWKDDATGYTRETKVSRDTTWLDDPAKAIGTREDVPCDPATTRPGSRDDIPF
jgi:hypothetical protein